MDFKKVVDRIEVFIHEEPSSLGHSLLRNRVFSRRVQQMVKLGLFLVTVVILGRTLAHAPAASEASSSLAVPASYAESAHGTATVIEHQDYSPSADLETEEIAVLAKAHRKIDIAMYAFTDLDVAQALASEARNGVRIRVYRDADQFAQEQSRAGGRPTTSEILRSAGIEVRVKSAGQLMHLKSYAVDDSFLRTGSANWSRSGLTTQDNDVVYLQLPQAVKAFESDFEGTWSRSDNLILH
jgi:phosphatidylserine/phosphatidylglycerophosphate/cardiolipin synthase-like enzyme